MTQAMFDRRISDLVRQLARLRAIKSGQLAIRTIEVKSYSVPAYRVRAHRRVIAMGRAR